MIQIKNIRIFFDDKLFNNSLVNIEDNTITIITGKSGSGKSTLLNIIGMLDDKSEYEYQLDGNRIEDKQSFIKYHVGYVFQDNGIIEDITVKDNFKVFYDIAGKKYNEEETKELCRKLDLVSIDMNIKAGKLSGGEKKRLAIALVMIKKPKILLLDEPTASLDKENSKVIVGMINGLKEEGLHIVVSTHNPELYDGVEHYHIEEGNIKTSDKEIRTKEFKKVKETKFHYMRYAMMYIKNHILKSTIMVIALMVSLGYFIHSFQVYKVLSSHFSKEALESISDREISVVNHEGRPEIERDGLYTDMDQCFDDLTVEKLKNIEHVENVIPFMKTSWYNYLGFDRNGDFYNTSTIFNFYGSIEYNGKEVNVYDEFEQNYLFTSCNEKEKLKECVKVDKNVEKGIIIPLQIANLLGIEELNHTKIKLFKPTILGTTYNMCVAMNPDDNIGAIEKYMKVGITEYVEMEVKGIYEMSQSNYQYNDATSIYNVFYDYDNFVEDYNSIISNQELINKINDFFINIEDITDVNYGLYSNMLVVEVDQASNVEYVNNKINETFTTIATKTVDSENNLLNDIIGRSFIHNMIQPFIIYVIIIISFVLIQIYSMQRRKKEFALFKANGLSQCYKGMVYEISLICLISIPFSLLFANGLCKYLLVSKLSLDYKLLLIICASIGGFILIITIMCISSIKKIDMNQELKVK